MSAREGGVTAERCNKAIKVWNGGGTSLVNALGPSRQGKGKGSVWGFPIYYENWRRCTGTARKLSESSSALSPNQLDHK